MGDSKTWWKVRDQLRGTGVYDIRASMLAINGVLPADKKADAAKAYKKVFTEMEALDLAARRRSRRSPRRRTPTCSRPSPRTRRSLAERPSLRCVGVGANMWSSCS